MQQSDLEKLIKRRGVTIASYFGKSGKNPASSEDSSSRKVRDLESASQLESLRAKKLSLNYTGKVRVRIKFYRRRLADYSRAISEKALVDCLVYGGLLKGDSEAEIWLIDEGQHKVESNEEERTELVLEYETVDFDNLWVKAAKNDLR